MDVRRVRRADFDMGVIRRTSKNPESGDFKSSTIFEKNKPTKAIRFSGFIKRNLKDVAF